MKIALDCNSLIELARPDDPVASFRLQHLLQEQDAVLIVPTPVIAEFLVHLEQDGLAWLTSQRKQRSFLIPPFDLRSAQECAFLERQALAGGMKLTGKLNPRQKVKVDRQILAIARVNGCSEIFTSDRGLATMAGWLSLKTRALDDLPLPPVDPQISLLDDLPIAPSEPLALPPP